MISDENLVKVEIKSAYYSSECVWAVIAMTAFLVLACKQRYIFIFEWFLVIGYMIYWHTKRYDQLVGKREELEKIQRGEIRRVFKMMLAYQIQAVIANPGARMNDHFENLFKLCKSSLIPMELMLMQNKNLFPESKISNSLNVTLSTELTVGDYPMDVLLTYDGTVTLI